MPFLPILFEFWLICLGWRYLWNAIVFLTAGLILEKENEKKMAFILKGVLRQTGTNYEHFLSC